MAGSDHKPDEQERIERRSSRFSPNARTKGASPASDHGVGRSGHSPGARGQSSKNSEQPSFDQVVETLFTKSFNEIRSSAAATSGDPETDRAIDLAVETLFVEEVDLPPPETAEIEAAIVKADSREQPLADVPAPPEQPFREELPESPALEEAHPPPPAFPEEKPPLQGADPVALTRLQEAILTLEWEISDRTVKVLARELARVRAGFRDNVTIDFAALAMRVVLNYVNSRMSRAHPESIRFLMEVTDYLKRSVIASGTDPLFAFHEILTRYDRYKSLVRKAEGIPDSSPAILQELEIEDPSAFAAMVKAQAVMLAMAGSSLASRLDSTKDPANLIRSFRFLITRSFNAMLESTRSRKSDKEGKESTVSAR